MPKRRVGLLPHARPVGEATQTLQHIMLPEEVQAHSHFIPCVTVRWGRRRQGKSLSLTAEGDFFRKVYHRWNRRHGVEYPARNAFGVIANYENHCADEYRPMLIEELAEYPDWAWNRRVLIDEISIYMHRRRWYEAKNVDFEAVVTQIGKRSIELSMATQFPQRIDPNIIDQIDLFVECQLCREGCGRPGHKFCVLHRVYDWWGQWSGNTVRRLWPPNPWEYDYLRWFHNCHHYFGQYRTEQIFDPSWLDDSIRQAMIDKEFGEGAYMSAIAARGSRDGHVEAGGTNGNAPGDDAERWDAARASGAPGPDQLADVLQRLASKHPDHVLNLRRHLKMAQEIDPEIVDWKALIAFCQGQRGWEVMASHGNALVRIP